jgi:cyclic-di-GMP-binding protein
MRKDQQLHELRWWLRTPGGQTSGQFVLLGWQRRTGRESFFFPAQLRTFRAMPSFDIVSTVNSMEIENAVNQAKKELASRFDFKGSNAEIVLDKNEIKLSAEDQFKLRALTEIMMGKLAKRSISLKNVEKAEADVSPLGHARQVIKIKQGLDAVVAKQVTGFIREKKFKVTTQIQAEEVRVTGKSRDELQTVIAAVRAQEFPVSLQFQNFRD